MASEMQIQEKERFTSYESYYGVDIDYDNDKKVYVACVWSERKNKNIELEDISLISVKQIMSYILLDNFHKSLTEIQTHFNHTSDFNNPQQNLENLRVAAKKKVSELLEDIL